VDPAEVKVADSARVRPTRDLKLVEGAPAAPRNVHVRPSPADTVPEMRTDPLTTIPAPTARRPRDVERSPTRYDRQERAVEGNDQGRRAGGRDSKPAAGASPRPAREPEVTGRPVREPDAARRPPTREPERRRDTVPPEGREARERERDREARPRGDSDREVLRGLFDPLSNPRPARDPGESRPPRGESGARPRGESAPPPRTAPPPRAAPPPPPRSEPRAAPPPRPERRPDPPPPPPRAEKRPKDRNH
jgi:hypothetical protein